MTKVYLWTKVAFACATVLIAELAALAADMPVKAPPPVVAPVEYSWTGSTVCLV